MRWLGGQADWRSPVSPPRCGSYPRPSSSAPGRWVRRKMRPTPSCWWKPTRSSAPGRKISPAAGRRWRRSPAPRRPPCLARRWLLSPWSGRQLLTMGARASACPPSALGVGRRPRPGPGDAPPAFFYVGPGTRGCDAGRAAPFFFHLFRRGLRRLVVLPGVWFAWAGQGAPALFRLRPAAGPPRPRASWPRPPRGPGRSLPAPLSSSALAWSWGLFGLGAWRAASADQAVPLLLLRFSLEPVLRPRASWPRPPRGPGLLLPLRLASAAPLWPRAACGSVSSRARRSFSFFSASALRRASWSFFPGPRSKSSWASRLLLLLHRLGLQAAAWASVFCCCPSRAFASRSAFSRASRSASAFSGWRASPGPGAALGWTAA